MIRRSQFIICLLALTFVRSRAPAQTPPAEEFQQWTNVAASWQVKPELAIAVFGEVHIIVDYENTLYLSQYDS